MRLWYFLSFLCRDYVLWRWAKPAQQIVDRRRIGGASERHAVSRLWWAAELIRNGPDYGLVEEAFSLQTGVEFVLSLDAFHNRAAALAFVRFLMTGDNGQRVADEDIKRHAQSLNHVLTTVPLDALAPEFPPDLERLSAWMRTEPDETTMFDRLPDGPDDGQVEEDAIRRVESLIASVAQPRTPMLISASP
jgi:hypothetical protein